MHFQINFVVTPLPKIYMISTKAEDGEVLKEKAIEVAVAGRIMTRRAMGKATFITLQDMSGKIQLYVARDNLPEGVYAEDVGSWDLGDIIGVKGTLFKTKTNELTIKTTEVQLLTKALVHYQTNSMV